MKYILTLIGTVLLAFFAAAQVPSINLILLTTGYNSPVDLKSCGDNRLFIVEQPGYIRVLGKDGTHEPTIFLDIHNRVQSTGNEQGLLTMAFSPNYKQDGFFYVNYINGSGNGSTRISRFSVMPNDSSQADPNSEVILLTFTQPAANHNGSTLMFGPDGYLYDSQGDGGSGSDPWGPIGNGQNINTFLAKMLRLDVTGRATYLVPPDNPFVGVANTKPEIWAYGLRNPWRCSFDRITGDMWIGDVGQDAYEEVDFQSVNSTGGENYGWRCREGFHACPSCGTAGCPSTGFTDPIFEMPQANTSNCSVTGGYVYRGAQYSKLFGRYIHTDYCSGRMWSTSNLGNNIFVTDSPTVRVNGTPGFLTNGITSFGEDNLGELYVCYRTGGKIYRLTETTDCNPVAFISLKDTMQGCLPLKLRALRGDTLSYQWYNSNGSISGATFYDYQAGQSGWYKVKVSKQQTGCEAMSDSVYVNGFDSTALVKSVQDSLFCISDPAFSLAGFYNAGPGIFSGNGVSNDDSTFVPASAGAGNTDIQFQYTNNDGCISRSSFNLQVGDKTSLVENISDSVYCNDENAFSLNGFVLPASGTFSGNGVTANNFDPSGLPLGATKITYTYTNNFGCVSTDSFQVRVDDCTDITEIQNDISFHIFPNPTTGKFSVEVKMSKPEQMELTVTDRLGKICFRKNKLMLHDHSVIMVEQALSRGIYTVKLLGENGSAVKSLVIE